MNKYSQFLCLSVFLLVAVASASQEYPTYVPKDANIARSEIPDIYKWQTDHIYKTRSDWENEFKVVEKESDALAAKCKGKLGQSSSSFLNCFLAFEEVERRLVRMIQYANFRFHEDEGKTERKEDVDKIQVFATNFNKTFSFMGPEIKEIGWKKIQRFMKLQPKLRVYNYDLKDFFRLEKYILSPKEEAILAKAGVMASGPSSLRSSLLKDMKWRSFQKSRRKKDKLVMNDQNWGAYRTNPNRKVRQSATEAFLGSYKDVENIWAQNYVNSIQTDLWATQSRGYPSTLDRRLMGNEVPREVYENLILTVNKNLPKTLHRYVSLRKKVLGFKDYGYQDNYVSLIPNFQKNVPYSEASKTLVDASKVMGDKVAKIVADGVKPSSGWVDVYPNKNKQSGAYNWGVYGVHTFIKMNYDNSYSNMFTLGHEMGHGLHFLLSMNEQPYAYHDAVLFTAEMASTGIEMLMFNHVLREAKKRGDIEELLYLYDFNLNNIKGSLLRQTQFAEFEKTVHEKIEKGEPLNAKSLNKIYSKLVKKYYGPDFKMGSYDEIEWAYISHFYRSFYVYVYATSVSAAIAMANGVESGEISPDKFVEFLSAGSSAPPIELAKKLGVDMSKPEPIQAACDYFASLLTEFERLHALYEKGCRNLNKCS